MNEALWTVAQSSETSALGSSLNTLNKGSRSRSAFLCLRGKAMDSDQG